MDHDHSAHTHTMKCPVCSADINIHAHDEAEATEMMEEALKTHYSEAGHTEEPKVEEGGIKNLQ